MKRTYTNLLTSVMVALFFATGAIAQETGDYRSAANGDWSAAATWEIFDGTDWNAATSSPDGSEMIIIQGQDTVSVDVAVTISGHVTVEGLGTNEGGLLDITAGTFTVADGGTYQHDRDGGTIPTADWQVGSTVLFTGVTGNGPGDRGQEYYNIVWNNPGQASNINFGYGTVTIGGTIRVIDSGSARFHLTDAGSGNGQTITIEGDVIVEGGQLTTTGSGGAATYETVVMGNVEVHDGGNLAPSRGSGGFSTWNLHGDFSVAAGATLQNSNSEGLGGFTFVGTETQIAAVSEETSYSGDINYVVAAGTTVEIAADTDFRFEDQFDVLETGTLAINGNFIKAEDGIVELEGTMDVNDGGTYVYARQEGPPVPDANWNVGSTIKFTGLQGGAPSGANRDFYNVIFDNADQASNFDVGWGGDQNEIFGDVHVLNTGGRQLRLTWAGRAESDITINIGGNVTIEGENTQVTTTGSGSEQTYFVNVAGDLTVKDGGYLSASRGSSGMAVWNLHGNLVVDGGMLGDSQSHDQIESFSFVADTLDGGIPAQTALINEISYTGPTHFKVADSSGVTILAGSEFVVENFFINEGIIDVEEGANLVFSGEDAVYEHAQDGGDVPTSIWEEESTALFTGIVGNGPGNASQDFWHLVLDTPNNSSNNHFDMNGNIIQGDIDIVSTGNARLYLTNVSFEEEREITILGDIYMHSGAFTTNGTGNGNSLIEIHHFGSIIVDGGNFSISRGSGPIVYWNMYEGDIIFNAGETQNSNPRSGSAFIFSGEDVTQVLDVAEEVSISHLPWTVDTLATLDIRESNFDDMSENIEVRAGATLATSFANGFEENLNSQNRSLSSEAHYVLNGTVAQQTGFSLPLVVAALTIDNEAGVMQSRDITITEFLRLANGLFDNSLGFLLDLQGDAELIIENGSLAVPIDGGTFPVPEPPYAIGDTINYNGSFSINSELGDMEADAWLIEGATGSDWAIVEDAADNDNRALAFTVVHEGADWNTNQAVNEPINVVEGEHYRASIYLKGDEAGRLVRFYAGVPAEGGLERVRGMDTPELELTTTWTMYEFEFTATADHETHGMRLGAEFNTDVNNGGVIYIDNVVLEKIESVSNETVEEIPDSFSLEQNYPNPFNPTTKIQYNLPQQAHVSLKVFDITGREVVTLVDNNMSAGSHTIEWDASNLSSGVYLYRITAGNFMYTRKLTLIKQQIYLYCDLNYTFLEAVTDLCYRLQVFFKVDDHK